LRYLLLVSFERFLNKIVIEKLKKEAKITKC